MHLERIRENQGSRFDRYVIGTLIIVFTFFVAQIPHTYAVIKAVGLEQLGTLDIASTLQALPPNTTLVLMLFPFAVVAVLVLVLIRYLHNISIREFITSRDKIDWKRIGFAFTTIVLLNSLFFIISYYTNPSHFQWNFDPQAFAILFLIAIVLVPLQTSAEELFFRGYLMQGFGQIFKHRIFPLLITSLLFGFMHFGNPEIDKLGPLLLVSYVSMGFFFGIITLMDEGLELALGYHAGNNLLISLLVTSDWTAFQTNSLFLDVSDPNVYMLAFMQLPMLLILLVLFSWKYKWKNYAAHLIGSNSNETPS
ncbi:MAG: CPBP family intramembrane metalloprotease [Flavobacteriaceae bacterium]|jgi:membrane protease YdiL (CAAX protease family)|nr:CPBP family intramembrane metalloprotease [Flavobacteriaceae bacterium]